MLTHFLHSQVLLGANCYRLKSLSPNDAGKSLVSSMFCSMPKPQAWRRNLHLSSRMPRNDLDWSLNKDDTVGMKLHPSAEMERLSPSQYSKIIKLYKDFFSCPESDMDIPKYYTVVKKFCILQEFIKKGTIICYYPFENFLLQAAQVQNILHQRFFHNRVEKTFVFLELNIFTNFPSPFPTPITVNQMQVFSSKTIIPIQRCRCLASSIEYEPPNFATIPHLRMLSL